MPKMSAQEIEAFIAEIFPAAQKFPTSIEHIEDKKIVVRLRIDDRFLRPGGSVAGPTLMTLADTTMYYLVLGTLGPVGMVYTTNLNMNFLRPPEPKDIVATGEMLKLGKRLAVGNVTLCSEGSEEPIAHATVSYSIP